MTRSNLYTISKDWPKNWLQMTPKQYVATFQLGNNIIFIIGGSGGNVIVYFDRQEAESNWKFYLSK